jgi:hypothetical protein
MRPVSRCAIERLSQAGEHRQVGVKLDALQATNTERGQRILGLESAEFALKQPRGRGTNHGTACCREG